MILMKYKIVTQELGLKENTKSHKTDDNTLNVHNKISVIIRNFCGLYFSHIIKSHLLHE